MNAIAIALKAEGVKTPSQPQRIWTYLHDSNRALVGIPSTEVSKALGISNSSVSSLLSAMERRRMVTHTVEGRSRRYMAVGTTYEWFPLAKVKPVVTAAHETVQPKFDLDSLTVREARELYNQLKRMFS